MIQAHHLTLHGQRVTLRPFTEADLPTTLPWYQDEELLFFTEGNDIEFRSIADVHPIYEQMSRQGHMLIIEADGQPIGECCLQRMNLDWVNRRYPDERIYRLPIMMGDKRYWGRGYGTETVGLLLEYAFGALNADRFFIPEVWAFNGRSLNLWRHFGFREVERRPETLTRRGQTTQTEAISLTLTRADYTAWRAASLSPDKD